MLPWPSSWVVTAPYPAERRPTALLRLVSDPRMHRPISGWSPVVGVARSSAVPIWRPGPRTELTDVVDDGAHRRQHAEIAEHPSWVWTFGELFSDRVQQTHQAPQRFREIKWRRGKPAGFGFGRLVADAELPAGRQIAMAQHRGQQADLLPMVRDDRVARHRTQHDGLTGEPEQILDGQSIPDRTQDARERHGDRVQRPDPPHPPVDAGVQILLIPGPGARDIDRVEHPRDRGLRLVQRPRRHRPRDGCVPSGPEDRFPTARRA